jgi:hypothetical protein
MPFSKKPAKNPGKIVTTSKRIPLMIEAPGERGRGRAFLGRKCIQHSE